MAYILKDAQGSIVAASTVENNGVGWIHVADDDREYAEFLEDQLQAHHPFRESDLQLARVLEDLISLLIDRDLIRFTDFPDAAQKRLIKRQSLRMSGKQLNLLNDDMVI